LFEAGDMVHGLPRTCNQRYSQQKDKRQQKAYCEGSSVRWRLAPLKSHVSIKRIGLIHEVGTARAVKPLAKNSPRKQREEKARTAAHARWTKPKK
jgi:hypothetical protein